MKTIDGENYKVVYDASECSIALVGTLRLHGFEGYAPIADVLATSLKDGTEITLDLLGLEFLNSSGIAMLSKYVIEARKKDGVSLTVKGSDLIPWQGKSLNNLKRLMPDLNLVFE